MVKTQTRTKDARKLNRGKTGFESSRGLEETRVKSDSGKDHLCMLTLGGILLGFKYWLGLRCPPIDGLGLVAGGKYLLYKAAESTLTRDQKYHHQ